MPCILLLLISIIAVTIALNGNAMIKQEERALDFVREHQGLAAVSSAAATIRARLSK